MMRKLLYSFCLLFALGPAQLFARGPVGIDPLPTIGAVVHHFIGQIWSERSQSDAPPILANVVTPTPTGNPIQSFCDAATVADLVANADPSGTIDWYDAATGGNLLAATDALADGDLVFAEQTIGGVPSADRLQVLVHFVDVDIAVSNILICQGESVELTAVFDAPVIPNSNYLGLISAKLVYLHLPLKTWPNAESFANNFNGHLLSIHSQAEVDFTINGATSVNWIGMSDRNTIGAFEWSDGSPVDYSNFLPGEPNGLTFQSFIKQFGTGFWDDVPITRLHPSLLQLDEVYFNQEWSTGDTSTSITATPTETTNYWVDTTLNGITCRKNITITVIPTPSPGITNNTGATELNCEVTTISLSATGGVSYSWSDGINIVSSSADLNVTTPGTYSVSVTADNGCSDTTSVVITLSDAPQAPLSGG
ncbi:MAG: lectin-like protein, partial [Flavobacteriaceae bacterium]|nr:lectin-like protein [Flavobacteriaceae bacterium]